MGKRVVLGMSGGVDSSVSALQLINEGHDVIGLFMKNWDDDECSAQKDFEDVARVCDFLSIPYYTVNFVKEYWENVFEKCLLDFELGITPNPDVLCNSEIKFNAFFKRAMELGADFVATGHYCQVKNGSLVMGADPSKDQSYFLHNIDGSVLDKVLFPIGHFQKEHVRELALKSHLPTAKKKDSTGLCFVGERKFRPFLKKFIKGKIGQFITLDGEVVGEHVGLPFYTIGQRKGLGLGGPGEAWYVAKKDVTTNNITVVRGHKHPELYSNGLEGENLHWIGKKRVNGICEIKVRYRQKSVKCHLEVQNQTFKVRFENPERAVTPGQYAVFYQGENCLGGGVIKRAFS